MNYDTIFVGTGRLPSRFARPPVLINEPCRRRLIQPDFERRDTALARLSIRFLKVLGIRARSEPDDRPLIKEAGTLRTSATKSRLDETDEYV